MTDSPSEPASEESAPGDEGNGAAQDAPGEETDGLVAFAAEMADRAGATSHTTEHDLVRLVVDRSRWVEAVTAVGEALPFFSWLSAIDWSREVAVGEPAVDPDELEERFDVLCRLSSVTGPESATLVTSVPHDEPWLDTLVGHFGGAEWHERETAEMFGIDFRGHPNLTHLYLPDAFEGHPLRKSYALLSREVKPWPGTVDVEDMPKRDEPDTGKPSTERPGTEGPSAEGPGTEGPSTENVEGGDGS